MVYPVCLIRFRSVRLDSKIVCTVPIKYRLKLETVLFYIDLVFIVTLRDAIVRVSLYV